MAALFSHLDIVKHLVEEGGAYNSVKDNEGKTPLDDADEGGPVYNYLLDKN